MKPQNYERLYEKLLGGSLFISKGNRFFDIITGVQGYQLNYRFRVPRFLQVPPVPIDPWMPSPNPGPTQRPRVTSWGGVSCGVQCPLLAK